MLVQWFQKQPPDNREYDPLVNRPLRLQENHTPWRYSRSAGTYGIMPFSYAATCTSRGIRRRSTTRPLMSVSSVNDGAVCRLIDATSHFRFPTSVGILGKREAHGAASPRPIVSPGALPSATGHVGNTLDRAHR